MIALMMRRQLLALLAAPLLAAPLLSGCGGEDARPAEEHLLRVTVIGTIDDTDPHRADSGPELVLASETQLGLVTVDASGRIMPGLAESWWVSEDGLSYIFRLRPAQWADGKPLTPDDVVASFRRMLSRQTGHPLSEWLAHIRNGAAVRQGRMRATELGVRALTDTVVEISLEQPRPAFLALLAEPSVAIVRQVGTQGQPQLMGLGPYRIESRTGQSLTLVANDAAFPADKPGYARIQLDTASDPLTGIQRFRNGETDVVTGGSIGGLAEARTLPSPAIARIEPVYGVYGYVAQTDNSPLADVRLRRALAMTVDRQSLTRQAFNVPGMAPVETLVPRGFPSYGEPAAPGWAAWPLDQRMTEARRLVAEAGYGPETPVQVSVLLPPAPEHQKILASISAAWRELGVEVEARIVQPEDYLETADKGEFDLALRPILISIDQPQVFLAPYMCNSPDNLGGFCIPEADQLMLEAGHAAAPELRMSLMKEAEQLMVEEAPLIPLFTPVRWSLVRETVNGWMDNPTGRHPLSALTPQPAR